APPRQTAFPAAAYLLACTPRSTKPLSKPPLLSPAMILLNVAHVTKRFGPEPVLDGVTFEVRPGERIGLVGPNGCGKSTLMKILVGREEPDSGIVERHPSSTIGYLEQHPEFPPDQTLWEAALEGMADVVAMQQEMEATAQAMAQEIGRAHV